MLIPVQTTCIADTLRRNMHICCGCIAAHTCTPSRKLAGSFAHVWGPLANAAADNSGWRQVKVRVGDEEKGTAAAEGEEEPGWAEVLEFAVSGDVASNEDEEIVVRVWDHHWVSRLCHSTAAFFTLQQSEAVMLIGHLGMPGCV